MQNTKGDKKSMPHKSFWKCISCAIEKALSHDEYGVMSFLVFFYTFLKDQVSSSDEDGIFADEYIEKPQWASFVAKISDIVISKYSNDLKDAGNILGDKLNVFQACIEKCTKENDKFNETDIKNYAEEYLSAYLKLSKLVTTTELQHQEILDRDGMRLLFMTGYASNEEMRENGGCLYRFFSPSIIENCLVLGNLIEEYRLELLGIEDEFSKKIRKEMYFSLLEEKAERFFFINTILDNSVFVNSIDKRSVKKPYRCERMENKSCVESIEMIRLVEKIDAYIKDRQYMIETGKIISDTTPIRILLMSHVDLTGENGLFELKSFLDAERSAQKFEFHVYYNFRDTRSLDYDKIAGSHWLDVEGTNLKTRVIQQNCLRVQLYRDAITDLMNDNISMYMNQVSLGYFLGKEDFAPRFDIVFVLDSPAMYRKGVEIKRDHPIEIYNEWIERVTSRGYGSEMPEKFSKVSWYPIPNLPIRRVMARYNMLALGLPEKEGHFEYKLREEVIELFIDRIREARRESELLHIHVIISSFHSVNNTNYVKWNLVREEHYRGKNFCLFTFKSPTNRFGALCENKDLRCKFKKKYIYFSLWNLYKHIDLTWLTEETSKIREVILTTTTNEKNLIQKAKEFYIRLSWEYNCNEKTAQFLIRCVRKEKGSNKLENVVETKEVKDFLLLLFTEILRGDRCGDKGLSLCFRNALMNAMYSRIRCLEDAVNYQMMKIHYDDEYQTHIMVSNDDITDDEMLYEIGIIEEVPSALLPDRWAIIRALKTLSSPMTEIDFYYMLHELQNVNRIVPIDFLRNVMAICTESNYQGSTLHDQSEVAWKNL